MFHKVKQVYRYFRQQIIDVKASVRGRGCEYRWRCECGWRYEYGWRCDISMGGGVACEY